MLNFLLCTCLFSILLGFLVLSIASFSDLINVVYDYYIYFGDDTFKEFIICFFKKLTLFTICCCVDTLIINTFFKYFIK